MARQCYDLSRGGIRKAGVGLAWTWLVSWLALALTLTVIHGAMAKGSTGKLAVKQIKFAVITHEDPRRLFALQKVLPAVDVAIEGKTVKEVLPGVKVSVLSADSKCDSKMAPINAFNFYWEDHVNVFMGPVCDYSLAPVARYCDQWGRWGTPVITPGGMAHDFGANKAVAGAEFPLLTRIGATFDSFSRAVVTLLHKFKYQSGTIKVLYNRDGHNEVVHRFCYLAMSALIYQFKTDRQKYHLYQFDVTTNDETNSKILEEEVGSKYGSRFEL